MRMICAALACALLVGVAGCRTRDRGTQASPVEYRDGTYTAQTDDYVDGWQDVVTMTVEGGKITDVDWNAFNPEGEDKKTLSQNGAYDMKSAGAKSDWHEQAKSLEEELVRQQDPARIAVKSDGRPDGISGATINVSAFVQLANEAAGQAK